jgi:CRISPR-associated protein Cas1
MLSYAYAIIAGECVAAAFAAGLDPHAGFLHADRAGRPALALDLMEPLRPLAAERAVLRLVNRRQARACDFETAEDGSCRLSLPVRRLLIAELERRLAEPAPEAKGRSIRWALMQQGADLAAALRRGEEFRSRLRAR